MMNSRIPDHTNQLFNLAFSFAEETSRHLFLTGKAGTGKTTFLRFLKEQSRKKMVVVAPTGVAAVNAGGMTIHSFFQLPFSPFIPASEELFSVAQAGSSSRHGLLQQLKINEQKQTLFRKMELLVIDEVSMLRCDVLDAIDLILRYYRGDMYRPFGGVQVLYIGDLYQLPPVISEDQWLLLREYYPGPFFFHAKVIQQAPPLYIELQKIYRQKDLSFIHLLNQVRNNLLSPEDLFRLNSLYRPGALPSGKGYIMLTTHNTRADAVNKKELDRLDSPTQSFEAVIEGDFSEKNFPTDRLLHLKKDAQVLFLKNDPAIPKKYYNGKIGRVSGFADAGIWVVPEGADEPVMVEKETWKNIAYTFNREKNQVEEQEKGSFTQFPVRLAWAITIHKSQGLTFEKAVIDAGAAFASGQVYVALSRCTGMEGIVLHSKIYPEAIFTHADVLRFADAASDTEELGSLLKEGRREHVLNQIARVFDLGYLLQYLQARRSLTLSGKPPEKPVVLEMFETCLSCITDLQGMAERFLFQIRERQASQAQIEDRLPDALTYFTEMLERVPVAETEKVKQLLEGKKGARKYIRMMEEIQAETRHHIRDMHHCLQMLSASGENIPGKKELV